MAAVRTGWLAVLAWALLLAVAAPAVAHHGEEHENAAAAQRNGVQDQAADPGARPALPADETGRMLARHSEQERPTGFAGRTISWLARLHPVAVHFPIALFPTALVLLLVARRRGREGSARGLTIAAGLAAGLAALLGWLDVGAAEPSAAFAAHRALGLALGIAGIGLATWAWRRPASLLGRGMILAAAALTALIFVQGGLGAVVTHGIEHLSF